MIELNKWYRFHNRDDKLEWLKEVKKVLPVIDITYWTNYDVLKFTGHTLLYRTTYNEKYMPKVDFWIGPKTDTPKTGLTPSFNCTDDVITPQELIDYWRQAKDEARDKVKTKLNSLYGQYSAKGENNMNLIEKAKKEVMAQSTTILAKKRKEFISETVTGKALIEAAKTMNEQKDVDVKWYDLFKMSMLSDTDTKELNALAETLTKECETKIEKLNELEELYNIAETFEQKQTLLKDYGVLKYATNL